MEFVDCCHITYFNKRPNERASYKKIILIAIEFDRAILFLWCQTFSWSVMVGKFTPYGHFC